MNRYKNLLLAAPIAIVDIATFSNVFEGYHFFEHEYAAVLAAIGFAALQIGSLVLFAGDLATAARRWLLTGAVVLLTVAGLCNVATAYLRGSEAFPAERLVPALGFGGSASALTVAAAWIFGLTLVGVGAIYWTCLGQALHASEIRKAELHQNLQTFLQKERS